MQEKQKYKIYSTNISSDQSSLIEIETIILNGLYRFSILGINQKNSSDIKDRVYSALRSQKLINLKSDNKKITVNLLPTNIDKKSNIYDLGIAMSCLLHMDQIELQSDVLVVGELSITGNIIPSRCILKSIHQAVNSQVRTIICSTQDIELLDTYQNNFTNIVSEHRLQFIVGKTIRDIVENMRSGIYYTFKNFEIKNTGSTFLEYVDITDKNIFKIILGICTNRNLFIENRKESYIKKFIKNLIYYSRQLTGSEILQVAGNLNKNDTEILESYSYPKVSTIDSQTQKDDLTILINESMFGFNIIEDVISLPEDILYLVKKKHRSAIVCFYKTCPCGNINNLFTSFEDDRCICIQRSVLRHRQRLHTIENGFFDFYIKDEGINNDVQEYGPLDYININKIISTYRNPLPEPDLSLSKEAQKSIETHTDCYEKADLDTIIRLAYDIAKLEFVIGKTKKPIVLKGNIDLAVEFIKKGF